MLDADMVLIQYKICTVSRKTRDQNVFCDISYQTRTMLTAHRLLNKFVAKLYKPFPPHLNKVSTLPWDTWNAHCAYATTELLQTETSDFSHLNCSLQIHQIWIQL